jgi:hypothetical protein
MMRIFRRKKGWRRVVSGVTRKAAKTPMLTTGAALTGIVTAVAASAAVSSVRRRTES